MVDDEDICQLSEKVELAKIQCLKRGCHQAAISASKREERTITIERRDIGFGLYSLSETMQISAVVGKRMGTSNIEGLQDNLIMRGIERAVNAANMTEPDPHFVSLARPRPVTDIPEIYDSQLANLPEEESGELAFTLLTETEDYDPRVCLNRGELKIISEKTAIINSEGVEAFRRGTSCTVSIFVTARGPYENLDMIALREVTRQGVVDVAKIGRTAAEKAVARLGARPMKTQNTRVLLEPYSLRPVFWSTVIPAVCADNVQKGYSFLCGRRQKMPVPETLRLADDGTLTDGPNTWQADGEGLPTQRTTIFEKGMFKSLLYDTYGAYREGRESTGNGESPCGHNVVPTNFVFEGTEAEKKNVMIEDTRKGILIGRAEGFGNMQSGEFTLIAFDSFEINGGEITQPVKGATICGTIFELMSKISSVGDDKAWVGSILTPTLSIGEVRVIGTG